MGSTPRNPCCGWLPTSEAAAAYLRTPAPPHPVSHPSSEPVLLSGDPGRARAERQHPPSPSPPPLVPPPTPTTWQPARPPTHSPTPPQINGSTLRPGTTLQLELRSGLREGSYGARIDPDWVLPRGLVAPVFLGYRAREGPDSNLDEW